MAPEEHRSAEQGPQQTGEPRRRRALRWVAHLLVLYGTLALITLPSKAETLWMWAGVSVLGATAADLIITRGELRFRPRARWLARAHRLPGAVLADTWLLAVVLVKRLTGRPLPSSRYEGVAFETHDEDESAIARRALAEAAASVAPNVYSLGIDREEEVLVVHQLVERDGIAEDADPLGLR